MEIGLVKRSFRLQGGGERQIAYLIEGLLAQGHQVRLYSLQPPYAGMDPGFSHHAIHLPPLPRALRALGFALSVRTALRGAHLDLVQSFERTLGQQIYRAGEGVHQEWVRRKRLTLSAWTRGWSHLSLFDRVMVALERRVFEATPLIIANSRRGKQEITQHYRIPESRVTIIYNGVDTTRFHLGVRREFRETQRTAWGVSSDSLVLVFVGAGFHRKGLQYLILALGELRRRGISTIRLMVVGKGRIAPYQRLAVQQQVADLVRFEGQRADVEQCYAGADLLVLPTLYDPFANVCLEAMACGLPVLTTAVNGVAELLQDGVNGRVVEDLPTGTALADVVQGLLPYERRWDMGQAACRTASEYPLSGALAQTLRVYETVLNDMVSVSR
jgi:UDP-glucose:(heptosyl)LPS alpha-1,3-glucosyltransferase